MYASTRSATSGGVVVGDRERFVEDRDALLELLVRDGQRRADHDDVPMRHQIEAAFERRLGDARYGRERLAGGVEGDEGLTRLAVLDELDAPEAAEPANLADRRMLVLQPAQVLAEDRAHLRGVLDDALLLERLDRGDRGRARERMAGVGEAAGEVLVARPVRDRLADDHRAEWDVARVDPLRDAEDVGDDVPVLDAEPLARPAEAGHHLVGDQEDSVLVAHLADRLEVAVGRDDDAVRPGDGLEDDR